MKLKYTFQGKEDDNYSDPKYLGEAMNRLDKELLNHNFEVEMEIDIKIKEVERAKDE